VEEQVERPLEHLGLDHIVHISTYLSIVESMDRRARLRRNGGARAFGAAGRW
jgi:hypothetical protein